MMQAASGSLAIGESKGDFPRLLGMRSAEFFPCETV